MSRPSTAGPGRSPRPPSALGRTGTEPRCPRGRRASPRGSSRTGGRSRRATPAESSLHGRPANPGAPGLSHLPSRALRRVSARGCSTHSGAEGKSARIRRALSPRPRGNAWAPKEYEGCLALVPGVLAAFRDLAALVHRAAVRRGLPAREEARRLQDQGARAHACTALLRAEVQERLQRLDRKSVV